MLKNIQTQLRVEISILNLELFDVNSLKFRLARIGKCTFDFINLKPCLKKTSTIYTMIGQRMP